MAGADGLGGRGALSFEQQFRHGLAGDEAVDQPTVHRALHGAQTGDGHCNTDHRLLGGLVQRHAQHAVIGSNRSVAAEQEIAVDVGNACAAAQRHNAIDLATIDVEHMRHSSLARHGEAP